MAGVAADLFAAFIARDLELLAELVLDHLAFHDGPLESGFADLAGGLGPGEQNFFKADGVARFGVDAVVEARNWFPFSTRYCRPPSTITAKHCDCPFPNQALRDTTKSRSCGAHISWLFC